MFELTTTKPSKIVNRKIFMSSSLFQYKMITDEKNTDEKHLKNTNKNSRDRNRVIQNVFF